MTALITNNCTVSLYCTENILLIIEQEDIQTRMQCEGRREEAQSRKQKGVREIREVEAQSGEVKKESRMNKHVCTVLYCSTTVL